MVKRKGLKRHCMGNYLIFLFSFVFTLLSICILPFTSASTPLDRKEISAKLSGLRMPFIENRGQVSEEVSFYAKTFGGTLYITRQGELVYSLPKIEQKERTSADQDVNRRGSIGRQITGVAVIRESFVGAKVVEVKGEERAETEVSYFRGRDPKKWRSGIPTYNTIGLGEVYMKG
jgi:hypothetical protein